MSEPSARDVRARQHTELLQRHVLLQADRTLPRAAVLLQRGELLGEVGERPGGAMVWHN